jgi:Skp family chaperone for outer membrane proteins
LFNISHGAQVKGELEQERARSKASIGRVRKDLESERDSINAALTEVRADLDRERERAKTLSSTLEATTERSRTITTQLEAANKQVSGQSIFLADTVSVYTSKHACFITTVASSHDGTRVMHHALLASQHISAQCVAHVRNK